MMVPSDLSLFVVAALILAVTPGPAVLYIVTRSVSQGRSAAERYVAACVYVGLGLAAAVSGSGRK
jgi:threonine/homoserine/homoserine lactone efflux protein